MKYLSLLFVIVFLVSCTSNTIYKKPENLIPKDTMLSMLVDMHIANSAKHIKNKRLQKDVNYMALVYEKYKIDSLRFDSSNTYYTSRYENYNEMLKEVKKRLKSKEDFFDKKLKEKDSLTKNKDKLEKKLKVQDSLPEMKGEKSKMKFQ